MTRRKPKAKARFKDHKRIFSATEKCHTFGEALKRKGVKFATVAGAGIGIITLGADALVKKYTGHDFPINTLNAAAIPATLGVAAYSLGQGFTALSNIFSAKQLNVADGNLLKQIEDEKKSRSDKHLSQLWDNVFEEESGYQNNEEERNKEHKKITEKKQELSSKVDNWDKDFKQHYGITSENKQEFLKHITQFRPTSAKLESTKEGFINSANYALNNHLHQREEKEATGFDISQLEAWYNGAPFTLDDEVLGTSFAYQKSIRKARSKLGISLIERLKENLFGNSNPPWHPRSMKKIGILAGSEIEKLDKKHIARTSPSYFTAQDVLWRKPEVDKIIEKDFKEKGKEAVQDLDETSKHTVRSTFSDDKKTAHNQIYWMFGKDYTDSLDFRLGYDIERAALPLNNPLNPLKELKDLEKTLDCEVYSHKDLIKKIKTARKNIKIVDSFLQENMPEVYQDPLQRRAVRIGYQLDRFNIQDLIAQSTNHSYHQDMSIQQKIDKNKETALGETKDIITNRIAKANERYTERIKKTRIHHELTKIQLKDYVERVDKLGQYNSSN